ncbi:DoxX family protein [Streptomyces sp. NPDC002490]|uniref:DoxX family protein n=1 Tax=Streptomyces sp. NPDC002490 TaxID=3154416 RepID=UPI003330C974
MAHSAHAARSTRTRGSTHQDVGPPEPHEEDAVPRRAGNWRELAGRYALLPLRLFLGATFLYAGVDKLTDGLFLQEAGLGSVGDLMSNVRDGSAVPRLVDLALHDPVSVGYAIAFAEIAVGTATLVGLLARTAALGGALVSLTLWLTVSWSTTPYYYGNDLVYLLAWTPLVLAGARVLSLDARVAAGRTG